MRCHEAAVLYFLGYVCRCKSKIINKIIIGSFCINAIWTICIIIYTSEITVKWYTFYFVYFGTWFNLFLKCYHLILIDLSIIDIESSRRNVNSENTNTMGSLFWCILGGTDLVGNVRLGNVLVGDCQDGPLTSYVKLWVAHVPGMPGTFSSPQTSKGTAS